MKVVRPTLKILLDDLDKLDESANKLRDTASKWIDLLDDRDNGYSTDQDYIAVVRDRLEQSIVGYRRQLAEVYDYMGDKGLV
jgi:hypothetical protein